MNGSTAGASRSGGVWRQLYILAFLLNLCLIVAIFAMSGGASDPRLLPMALSNVLPPALLGILVARLYRADRSGWHWLLHVACALGFALVAEGGTLGILWLMLRDKLRMPPALLMWGALVDALIFAIIAGVANARRVGAALAFERERAAAAEASRARAELSALRSRIDPHFLFNTLHSLLALVHHDPLRAEEAIEQFGDLLRYTFGAGDGSEERTLRQEWQLVENYVALERLRLGDRLRITEHLDPEVAGVPLPVLTLQPVVENAIRYAVAPRAGGGTIDIRATPSDRGVLIAVTDDGPGASDATLEAANGRGLHLVRERLDRLYFGEATMRFESPEGGGLRVSIELPLEGE
jgi:signal transduction histidine kinase